MYGWEQRVLVKHYLEQGLTKTAIAERVGVSRRTLHYWLATEQLDLEAEGPVRYPPRPTKLDRYQDILTERLDTYPELTAVRLFRGSQSGGVHGEPDAAEGVDRKSVV